MWSYETKQRGKKIGIKTQIQETTCGVFETRLFSTNISLQYSVPYAKVVSPASDYQPVNYVNVKGSCK